MAIKTKAQLHIENDNFIYDNYNEEVTASNVNQLIGDMIDSFAVTSGTSSASTLSETLSAGNDTGNQQIQSPDGTVYMQIYDDGSFFLESGTSVFQMNSAGVYITDYSLMPSMDFGRRQSYDAADFISIDWDGRYLYDSSLITSIDYNGRIAYDSGGNGSIDWDNHQLLDGGQSSIDWHHRLLFDANYYAIMDYSSMNSILIGDVNSNLNSVLININNNDNLMSFVGNYTTPTGNFTSDMFTMYYPAGEVIFGDYNRYNYQHFIDLIDNDQQININGLYNNVLTYIDFYGTGLNDLSTDYCNSNSSLSFIFEIDSSGNPGYIFDTPIGTLNIGDIVTQTSPGSSIGVQGIYLGVDDDGFSIFSYVMGSTPFNIGATVQTPGALWTAVVNSFVNDKCDTFFYLDSLGNSSSYNLIANGSQQVSYQFYINYTFNQKTGHTIGDYWEIQYNPVYGRYGNFSSGKSPISFGDIDGIYNNMTFNIQPQNDNISVGGNNEFGNECSSFSINTKGNIVMMGDIDFSKNHTSLMVHDNHGLIETAGFKGFVYSYEFFGSLNDIVINKRSDTSFPLNTTVNYNITISNAAYPYDTMSWTDSQGNSGSQLLDGFAITLSFGLVIYFANTTGHALGDYWDLSANNKYDLSSHIGGTGRTYQTGDINNVGNSTWTKLDDRKGSYDINGLQGIVFSGIQPNITGTTTLSEQLFGSGMFFPFPVNFTGPDPTDYTVQIDSVGTPDTFAWQDNQGNSGSMIPITGSAQALSYNVTITFSATTGAVLGDSWSFNYDNGAGRMLSLNGAGNSLFPLGGYMQFGDVDGGVSGTQIMIIPEFKVMGIFGNMFNLQQDPTFPSFISEVTSGYPTFGNHQILSGLDGNAGTEASMAFGNSVGMSQNDYWRVGANIFDATDNSFSIANDNIGNALRIDTSGIISFNNGQNTLTDTAGTLGQVLTNGGSNDIVWRDLPSVNMPHIIWTVSSGNNITIDPNTTAIIKPSGTIATLTITLPPTPADNTVVKIKFNQTVTALTIDSNGAAGMAYAPTGLQGQMIELTFDLATNTWY